MKGILAYGLVVLIGTATFASLGTIDRFQSHQLQVLRQRIAAAESVTTVPQPTAAIPDAQNRQARQAR
jgi:hypothetical protein